MSAASNAWHKTPAGRAYMREYRRAWIRRRRRSPAYRARERAAQRESYRATSLAELLASTFPGCWKDPEWLRIYKRAAQRARRTSLQVRAAEAAHQRVHRQQPEVRARVLAQVRKWKAEHPEKVRAQWRRWYRKYGLTRRSSMRAYYRARKRAACFFCGHSGKPGPGNGVQRILRMVPDGRGRLIEREVLWCGRC